MSSGQITNTDAPHMLVCMKVSVARRLDHFWMLANGLPLDRLPAAVLQHYEAYNDKSITNDEGDTFKWACGGMGAKNNQLRIRVLQEIMQVAAAL